MTVVELRTTSMAVGGEAIGREASGRVVFVSGGVPDETVRVELNEEKARFARGSVVEVLDPSPERVTPPCPHRIDGCGGCDWQHIDVEAQRRLRVEMVRGELRRALDTDDPVVAAGPVVSERGGRTTVRGTTDGHGRFSYRRRRSNDPIPVDSCLIAHPLVEEIIEAGDFGSAESVTIRVGAATGERMVVVDGDPAAVSVPEGVQVVGAEDLAAGKRAWIHEEVAGRRWRVSAGSFFQAGPVAAEALVDLVGQAVADHGPDGRLVDLCCGVGLFAGTVAPGRPVIGIERSAAAIADARANLADLDDLRLIRVSFDRWRPARAAVVVADPARTGLGRAGVGTVAATGAGLCVLVTCDVGAMRRDVQLLVEAGYDHVSSTTLDLFAHTGQVEVVTVFRRH